MAELSQLLRRMINRANLNRGQTTQPHKLPGGLIIRLRLDKQEDQYTVFLSREGQKPPSEQEIKTFLAHWPIYKQPPTGWRAGIVFQIPIWPDEQGAKQ